MDKIVILGSCLLVGCLAAFQLGKIHQQKAEAKFKAIGEALLRHMDVCSQSEE